MTSTSPKRGMVQKEGDLYYERVAIVQCLSIKIKTMKTLIGFLMCAALATLSACGGSDAPAPITAPGGTPIVISAATGGQAANNGSKTVSSASVVGSSTSSISIGANFGSVADGMDIFSSTAGLSVNLHLGNNPALASYLSSTCSSLDQSGRPAPARVPACVGVVVDKVAKTVSFTNTVVYNDATTAAATINGTLAYN
jgi:hypothetical protein